MIFMLSIFPLFVGQVNYLRGIKMKQQPTAHIEASSFSGDTLPIDRPKRQQTLANGEPLDQRIILRLTLTDHQTIHKHLDRMRVQHPRMTISDLLRDHYFSRGAFTTGKKQRTKPSLEEFAREEGTDDQHQLFEILYQLAATRRSLQGYMINHNQIARRVNVIDNSQKLLVELQSHERLVQPVATVIARLEIILNMLEEILG